MQYSWITLFTLSYFETSYVNNFQTKLFKVYIIRILLVCKMYDLQLKLGCEGFQHWLPSWIDLINFLWWVSYRPAKHTRGKYCLGVDSYVIQEIRKTWPNNKEIRKRKLCLETLNFRCELRPSFCLFIDVLNSSEW